MRCDARVVRNWFLGAVAVTALLTQTTHAQDGLPKSTDPKIHAINLRTVPYLKDGKIAIVQGAVDGSGYRFVVENLDVLQPVAVTVLGADPNDEVNLRLAKKSWDESAREGSTRGSGERTFKVRTHGDMRIVVTSKEGLKPFQLVVWAGDERQVPIPPIFATGVTAADADGGRTGSSGTSPALWTIAGLCAIAVILLAVIAFRKSSAKGSAAVILPFGILTLAASVLAAPQGTFLVEVDPLVVPDMPPPLHVPPQTPPSVPPAPLPSLEKQTAETYKAYNDGIQKGAKWANLGVDLGESFTNWYDAYKHLSPDDAPYDPDYSPPGSPQIPLQCWKSPGCAACFNAAHGELNLVRYRFEKLRRVSERTRAFYTASLSFGDSVAGIHGVAGLGWQAERIKIMQAMKTFDGAHDAKYEELMAALEAALKKIAACEQTHFETADWYNRFGFIYYTFMADRYRR
jgi:hypothetical protein